MLLSESSSDLLSRNPDSQGKMTRGVSDPQTEKTKTGSLFLGVSQRWGTRGDPSESLGNLEPPRSRHT